MAFIGPPRAVSPSGVAWVASDLDAGLGARRVQRPIPDPHSWRTVAGRLLHIAALGLFLAALIKATT